MRESRELYQEGEVRVASVLGTDDGLGEERIP